MRKPAISVVMPMYNAERYVEDAVRSVLAQTFTDFELIVVNDGSTDGSGPIVDRIAAGDGRMRVIHLEKNVGNSRANNHGFAEACGRYIACMDADDVCHPQRLEKQVAFMDIHKDVGLVATQYWRLAPTGEILRKTRSRLQPVVIGFYLFFGVPFCNPTTFFRREVVEAFLPDVYDPALKAAADYDFLRRVAGRWAMAVLPDYLFYYRINPNGLSKTKKVELIQETVARAVPLIRQTLPGLAMTDAELGEFIELQGNARPGLMTREKLGNYTQTLHRLCDAYCVGKTRGERFAVQVFALEMEAKTLLGRYRIYRKPGLLVLWMAKFAGRLGGLITRL